MGKSGKQKQTAHRHSLTHPQIHTHTLTHTLVERRTYGQTTHLNCHNVYPTDTNSALILVTSLFYLWIAFHSCLSHSPVFRHVCLSGYYSPLCQVPRPRQAVQSALADRPRPAVPAVQFRRVVHARQPRPDCPVHLVDPAGLARQVRPEWLENMFISNKAKDLSHRFLAKCWGRSRMRKRGTCSKQRRDET